MKVTMRVNGVAYERDVEPRTIRADDVFAAPPLGWPDVRGGERLGALRDGAGHEGRW